MAKTIGKGGNGVVGYIYHGGREFAVKKTGLHQEELEIMSLMDHCNIIEVLAVIKGIQDSCYLFMSRMTGESG